MDQPSKVLELALSLYLFQKESQKFIFFDRGIIDAVQLNPSQLEYFQHAAKSLDTIV